MSVAFAVAVGLRCVMGCRVVLIACSTSVGIGQSEAGAAGMSVTTSSGLGGAVFNPISSSRRMASEREPSARASAQSSICADQLGSNQHLNTNLALRLIRRGGGYVLHRFFPDVLRACSTRRRTVSERVTWLAAAHASIAAIIAGGSLMVTDGSRPVAGRPLFFGLAEIDLRII
jgi:hypothetical protein